MFVVTPLLSRLHHLSSIVQSNNSISHISDFFLPCSIVNICTFPCFSLSQLWSSLNVVHCTGHRCLCTLCTLLMVDTGHLHWQHARSSERERLLAPELFLITLISQHSALTATQQPLGSRQRNAESENRL